MSQATSLCLSLIEPLPAPLVVFPRASLALSSPRGMTAPTRERVLPILKNEAMLDFYHFHCPESHPNYSRSGLFVKCAIILNPHCPSFQEESEIPASVFVKEPVPAPAEGKEEFAEENKSLEETLHNVELSSDDELPCDEEGLEDSADEKLEESRAEKIKRSGLKKVDSLKKAFSRQNIEKKMNKLGTKIVSVERREKIKKSLASTHQKASSGISSSFKVSPLSFGRKKVREGESSAENETKLDDQNSFTEGVSEASLPSGSAEDGEKPALKKNSSGVSSNADLTIAEDEEEESVDLQQGQQGYDESGYMLDSEEMEGSGEKRVQPAVLQVDQTA